MAWYCCTSVPSCCAPTSGGDGGGTGVTGWSGSSGCPYPPTPSPPIPPPGNMPPACAAPSVFTSTRNICTATGCSICPAPEASSWQLAPYPPSAPPSRRAYPLVDRAPIRKAPATPPAPPPSPPAPPPSRPHHDHAGLSLLGPPAGAAKLTPHSSSTTLVAPTTTLKPMPACVDALAARAPLHAPHTPRTHVSLWSHCHHQQPRPSLIISGRPRLQ